MIKSIVSIKISLVHPLQKKVVKTIWYLTPRHEGEMMTRIVTRKKVGK